MLTFDVYLWTAVDPAAWVPDAVVINIGTNDVGVPHGNTSSIWVQTYLTFLRKWRKAWPSVHKQSVVAFAVWAHTQFSNLLVFVVS